MDKSEMALKNIEFQMNKHLKTKFGQKYQKVNIDTKETNMYNANVFSDVVDSEIKNTLNLKKWNSLPMYFKWNCIIEYFDKNNIIDKSTIENIKANLSRNKLEGVVYDHINKEITSLVF